MNSHSESIRFVSAEEWLRVNDSEFLTSFISEGGSSIRFVSGDPTQLAAVRRSLAKPAEGRRLHCIHFDPSELSEEGKRPDFHLIKNFFFHVAKSIEWKSVARDLIVSCLREQGIHCPDSCATTDYHRIAEFNGMVPDDLLHKYQRLITTLILRDFGMAIEFRIALTALGRSQLLPEEITPTEEEVLLGWLRGEKPIPGGAHTLKRIRIFERIGQANARIMLESMLHWLRKAGVRGLVATFDFRPYELLRRSRHELYNEAIDRGATLDELKAIREGKASETEAVRYSTSAYIAALELLRHFIDEVERLEGFFLVVFGSPQFFDEKPKLSTRARRFFDYNALQTRIGLEVRDVTRQNPSATLVHLGADADGS